MMLVSRRIVTELLRSLTDRDSFLQTAPSMHGKGLVFFFLLRELDKHSQIVGIFPPSKIRIDSVRGIQRAEDPCLAIVHLNAIARLVFGFNRHGQQDARSIERERLYVAKMRVDLMIQITR